MMESSAIRAYEIFKEQNFPQETAKELAEIIASSRDEHLEKWVASKEDLASVKLELKEDMLRMENSLDMKIMSVKAELKEDITDLRSDLKEDIASLRVEIAKAQSSTNRWLIGIAIALSGVVIAMINGVLR